MYFEAHASYFILPSHMIPFATSLFDGAAKTWWVHERLKYWSGTGPALIASDTLPGRNSSTTSTNNSGTRGHGSSRKEDVRTSHGQRTRHHLLPGARSSGHQGRKTPRRRRRGLMVKATRLGVPSYYTNTITGQGRDIPGDYDEWKARIILMYEERQKNWAFHQAAGSPRDNRPPREPLLPPATPRQMARQVRRRPKHRAVAIAEEETLYAQKEDASGVMRRGTWQGLPKEEGLPRYPVGTSYQQTDNGVQGRRSKGGKSSGDLGFDSPKIAKDLFTGTPFNPIGITKHLDTDFFPTHLDIPASNLLAFNVSSTTSPPVSESQNRYAALSVEECNNNNDSPLKGCHDTLPARAQAKAANPAGHEAESLSTRPLLTLGQTDANHRASNLCGETQSMKASGEKSTFTVTPIDTASLPRITDGTMSAPKGKLYDEAAQVERPSTPKVDVESQLGGETTARLPDQQRVPLAQETTMPQQQPFPVG
ncbi:uncharacterized protein ARMOST_22506 [Armillaria ostoyae]|uniref:Uncharacterized protein n=1 Tax=Armillaria ostoyae TaxID=47428 RepID=A0A284SD11_ARMOS|nr:uncharacterized protein ARMOST_22506 [Armillaria ostoyae]